MRKRNYELDFWKFVFTILVVLLHYDDTRFTGGYLGVDFFFICSGYFLYNTFKRKKQSPKQYFCERVKTLLPLYMVGLMLCVFYNCTGIIIKNGINIVSICDIWEELISEVFEMLGIQMMGFSYFYGNFTLWYIAVLVSVGYLLYYMLYKNEKNSVQIFFPLMIIVGYSLVYHNGGKLGLDYNVNYICFFNSGVWRGASGMCLGILLSVIKARFENATEHIRPIWKILSSIICITIIFYCVFITYHTNYDFIFLVVCAFLLLSTGWNTFINRIIDRLGIIIDKIITPKGMYAMYILSRFYINLFWREFPYDLYAIYSYIVFVVTLIIVSILVSKAEKRIIMISKKILLK